MASAQRACIPDGPTIGQVAGNAPELSTLVAAVQAANLTDVLSGPGPIDVFAPTDAAFAKMLTAFGVTAEALLAQTAFVANGYLKKS